MNENTKTITFVAVALAVLLIAWVASPRSAFDQPLQAAGEKLYPDFKDPLAVTSLEVTRYDEATSKVQPFKVEQVKGRWAIPYHENYPTDAKDQLAEAATSLTNLSIVGLESDNAGDHEQFGVIDPKTKDLKAGTSGVGTRVTMKDKDDKPLVDLIIGKEAPGSKELRYVRRAGEDAVFTAKIRTDKLSTDFGDWIEKDLLKLNTFDVKRIRINDYSVDVANPDEPLKKRGRMALEYQETGEPKWKLAENVAIQDGKATPIAMAADEELNTQKLDDMRNALGDLKIVDVRRKPEAVSANLKRNGTAKPDQATMSSLGRRGFYFDTNSLELYSAEGEARVETKDGVEYVLRFGNLTEATGGQSAKKEAGKDAKDSSNSTARYLFVVAEFNEKSVPLPDLKPLPPEAKPESKPAEAKKEEAKKGEGKKDEIKKDPKAERDEIEKENKRKKDEYDDKVKKAKEKVKELNDRFAAWYYVIDDSVYQKIHLGRKDVVKKKEAKKEGEAKAPTDSPAEFKGLMNELPAMKKDEAAPKKDEAPEAAKAPPAPAKVETPEAKKEVPPAPKADAKPAPKKEAVPAAKK